MTLLFALLALAAQASVVVLAAAVAGRRFRGALSSAGADLLAAVGAESFRLALIIAAVATAGSLYLSEVAHFVPCRLCWYQRAAMYPLGPLLIAATWRGWFGARWVVFSAAVVGGCVSIWHVLLERYPSLETSTSCDPANPCSLIWVRRFGYVTIPTMALSGFALIAVLMLVATRRD